MKVCTDACLFGAWSTSLFLKYKTDARHILDIGTGTGLLSLMIAQKMTGSIDAVEINEEAAKQATENIQASPWETINVYPISILNYQTDIKYDLIITNPPFYEGSLLSPAEDRNAAMHDRYLTLVDLLGTIRRLIAPTGYAAVLLPYSRESEFLPMLADHRLNLIEMAKVRQTVRHKFFRSMFFISPLPHAEPHVSEMSIHDAERQYTNDFKILLTDYYLKL